MSHLVVSITGHGFGHVAQTAPVLNRLHELMPELRITLRSTVPLAHLRSRIHVPFELLYSEGDIGMVMSSALDVCVEESRAAYRAFHADWEARVAEEARLLCELGADLAFSNVGYLPLAGAQRAGIPNAALCSLNWFDIYRHYCIDENDSVRATPSTGSGRTEDETIAAQIYNCYAHADAFLRTTPGMAMDFLPNLVPVAPIAAVGKNRREELNSLLGLSPDERLVLVSMGGIAGRLPVERWPRIAGLRWLVQSSWQVVHPDAVEIESLQMSFGDLLASCDALLCKPGYGSFVEAASSGVPVLYVSREGWPEAPALVEWLRQHGRCREITREALEHGGIAEDLTSLWSLPRAAQSRPEGIEQAAGWLVQALGRGS